MAGRSESVDLTIPKDPPWRAAIVDHPGPIVAVEQPPRTLADSNIPQALLARMMAAAYLGGKTCVWIAPNAAVARRRLARWVAGWPAGEASTPPMEVRCGRGGVIFVDAHRVNRCPVDRAALVVVDQLEQVGQAAATAGTMIADTGRGRCWLVCDGRLPAFVPPAAARVRVTMDDLVASGLADETARARVGVKATDAPSDLAGWAARYLPHYMKLPANDLHRYLAETLERGRTERGLREVIQAPRESAKSTWVSLIGVLDDIVHAREKFIWLVSGTLPQAKLLLASVKAELEGNEAIARDYPEVAGRGPTWAGDMIIARNGVMVSALSAGQSIRGRRHREVRPTKIVVDDPQDEKHMYSATLRQRTIDWFNGSLMKAGGSTTNVLVLGNSIHREALVMDLARRPVWKARRFPEIVRWPDRMELWAEWQIVLQDASMPASEAAERARAFYDAHREEMDAGAVLLWPEARSLYDLMLERAAEGAASFARERQCEPISPEACEWPEDYFGDHIWFDRWPDNPTLKIVACDPSKGRESRNHDYQAIVTMQRGRDGVLYVDCDMQRRPVESLIVDLLNTWEYVRPHDIGIEAVQFQSLLCGLFESEAAKRGFTVPVSAIPSVDPKPMRIRGLGRFLSSRLFRFKATSPGARMLVDQLRDFPNGAHDDGPDALEMAVRLGADVVAGRLA